MNSTTAELAGRAGVSDPMVSRLCRSLGCSSFPDLKLQLARSLGNTQPLLTQDVTEGDAPQAYISKRIAANQSALEALLQQLDTAAVEEAVTLLANAGNISIFGMGGCASVAEDAHHKLFRLGTPTACYSDNLMQRMAAAAATEEATLLVISFTGRTRSMLEAVETAKSSGARILTISESGSPLADMADVSLSWGVALEDTTSYVPMSTRIAILTIIDILVTGVALALGPGVDERLLRIKHSLESTKLPP